MAHTALVAIGKYQRQCQNIIINSVIWRVHMKRLKVHEQNRTEPNKTFIETFT